MECKPMPEPEFTRISLEELKEKRKMLNTFLLNIQEMMKTTPYPEWESIYNRIGDERDRVKNEIEQRPEN
jgi:hypothetical protein